MKIATFILLASMLLGTRAVAGDIFPNTPAGQVARNYVSAFNGGDAAMRAFLVASSRPADQQALSDDLDRYRSLHTELGAMMPVRIIRQSAGSIEFEVNVAAGGTATLTVMAGGRPVHFEGLRITRTVRIEKNESVPSTSDPGIR